METFRIILEFILHIDLFLKDLVMTYGPQVYGILFLVLFAETGLVVTPFLPGDSLLFVAGTFVGAGLLAGGILIPLLIVAAIAGGICNFHIGKAFGSSLLDKEKHRLIKPEHIEKAQLFYRKHGGKAIVLARFIPLVRSLAPFVAGIGRMDYRRFWAYNALGGILWVTTFVLAGMVFGASPWVVENMSMIVWAVVLLSLVVMLIAGIKSRPKKKHPTTQALAPKQLADARS